MREKLATFWKTIDFPGMSEFNRKPKEPLQGAKMTVMDILEFRDINGPARGNHGNSAMEVMKLQFIYDIMLDPVETNWAEHLNVVKLNGIQLEGQFLDNISIKL